MKDLFTELNSGRIILSDGAWGTMLQNMGLQSGECPEYWNLTHPDRVKEVAATYVKTGSNIVLTNTFGGSCFKLSNYDLQDKTQQINRRGVELSKEAAGDNVLVAASVGPTGKFLQPLGEVSQEEMYTAFCEQISAMVDGGANAILIETMSDLSEATLAVKAAKEVSSLPVMATMTFEKGKLGYRTMMGFSINQTVKALNDANADILGTNCGNGIEQICEIIAEMRKFTSKFLIAHPNAGLPKLVNNKTVFNQTPEEMAQYIHDLIRVGANIIGGCCGTTPDHIEAMAQQIKNFKLTS